MAEKIRMVLMVPESTRKALKVEAARQDLDMSELATVALDGILSLMAEGKPPQWLTTSIAKCKKEREDGAEG